MLETAISVVIAIGLILAGVPVMFAYATAVVYLVFVLGYDPSFLLPYGFQKVTAVVLLAFPFYMLLGTLMERSGMAEYLVRFVNSIASHIRGGLGAVTAISCGVFGAVSGSSTSAIGVFGPIMIPRMIKQGYPRGYATAFISTAAGLALLIPPSLHMIIYGWVADASIAAVFLAGVIPGIILILLLILFNRIMTARMPEMKKPQPWGSFKEVSSEFVSTGWKALPALVMPIAVLGSIYAGIATPTEAAAIGAIYAIPVGIFIYRGLTLKGIGQSVLSASLLTGSVMLLVFCVIMISRVITMEGIPGAIASGILSLTTNKYIVLLLVNVMLIFMGMFMDDISVIVLGVLILTPIVKEIGLSPIHFSGIITTNAIAGLYTPPMAVNYYIGQHVGKSNFAEMFKPAMQIIYFLYVPTALLVTYFPPLTEWLPVMVFGPKILIWAY